MIIPIMVLAGAAFAAGAPARGPQPVFEIKLDVDYQCLAGELRYSLDPRTDRKGPGLSVATINNEARYLYLSEAGYRVLLEGDRAGAGVFLSDASTNNRISFASIDPRENGCGYEGARGSRSERIMLNEGVRAELEVKPRTGIFRPTCYKNITTGFYVLDLWKIATLRLADRLIELKSADSADFESKEECRGYFEAFD